MKAELKPEHNWLEGFIGDWEVVGDSNTPEDQKVKHWIERGRSLLGTWLIVEGDGQMPGGGEAKTLLVLGFDPNKGKFVGSWAGSMMTHQWLYEGSLNAENELVLDCVGPDFSNPAKLLNYQDIYSFEGSNRRVLTSKVQKDDGTWEVFMRMGYSRVGTA